MRTKIFYTHLVSECIGPSTQKHRGAVIFCDVGVHATSTSILNSVANRHKTAHHGPVAFPPSGPLLLFLYVEPCTAALETGRSSHCTRA
jgi:hypothetical protein